MCAEAEKHIWYIHFVKFMDCVAKFLLYVADAAEGRRVS